MSAFDSLTQIPCAITAGEADAWTETPTDYPPASYSITYAFAGQTPQDGFQQFTVAGAKSGATYTFTFATTIKPGRYRWEKQVTRASDSTMKVVDQGSLTVRANLAVTPTTTAAAAMLAALQTAITTLTTTVNQTVSFNGQSYTKADLAALLKERVRLQAEVYGEQQAILALSGTAQDRRVGTRFVPQVCGGFPYANDGRIFP